MGGGRVVEHNEVNAIDSESIVGGAKPKRFQVGCLPLGIALSLADIVIAWHGVEAAGKLSQQIAKQGQFEGQIFDRATIDIIAQPEHKIELRQGAFAPHCLAHPDRSLVGPVIAEPRVVGRLNVKLVDLQKTKP